MNQKPSTLMIALVVFVAGFGVWLAQPLRGRGEVQYPEPGTAAGTQTLPKGTAIGATGCLSAACHGSSATDALCGKFDATTWQSSGTAWVARDPHSRAYEALRTPLATEMMRRMKTTVPATQDERCLACHTNPTLANEPKTADPHVIGLRAEGVSCEACHGNAGGWVREHTTWKGDRTAVYAATGMNPLYEIGERPMTCLGCHVGAPADPSSGYPARDMNHDMIAAGHPRLNFDFAEYHRALPKHWEEKNRTADGPKPRGPGFEERVWLVGRVAHAEAACKLLADRAERAKADDPRTPWPEFAEYHCAACHHTVLPEDRRTGSRPPESRPPGSADWQLVWPATGAGPVPSEVKSLRALQELMQSPRPPGFAKVIEPAHVAAGELSKLRWVHTGRSDADVVATARRAFPGKLVESPDWDTAGQLLWGLAAMERGRKRVGPHPEFDRTFDAVRLKDWGVARPSLDRLLAAP